MAIGTSNSWRTTCLVVMVSFISLSSLSYQSDTILPGQSLRFGQTIISRGGVFKLGFYSTVNSGKYYVGIWYKSIPLCTPVWVANRNTPILPSARDDAKLILTREGDLQLQVNGLMIWNTNTSATGPKTTKAVILDSGNLIVGSDSSPSMWESFNYPVDVWLPGAKIGLDMTIGKTYPTILTSRRDLDDLSSGIYSLGIDLNGSRELLLWNSKTNQTWRIGPSDFSEMSLEFKSNITFNVSRINGVNYATYLTPNNSTPSRMMLDNGGQLRQLIWNEKRTRWLTSWIGPKNFCESYAICGSNGICTVNQSTACICPKGFQPRYLSDWELGDHSGGCVRRNGLQCLKDKDGFAALDNITWPLNFQILSIVNDEACRVACEANCSCSAYGSLLGCYLWFGDLLGIKQLDETTASDVTLFLKLGSNELPKKGAKKGLRIPLTLSITLLILVLGSLAYYVYRKKIMKGSKDTGQDLLLFDLEMNNKRRTSQVQSNGDLNGGNRDLALPIFSLASVSSATDNFSSSNKLGEGGFGLVYKGKLRNSQEVAVKRLSKHSDQGLEELVNEAKLIAKLQHTNLVRLLGCCIQQDEKILIYEYMPNKSLDFFLFDRTRKEMLDWNIRLSIIEGIAQGLLYLHHYSGLRIIHRDLKASNILLDADMKPKISDFGMARIFGRNQLQANTKHIVGTYGYMPPEYALVGLFSVKTDIFSFGVLLLEILSGERNTSICYEDCLNLLGYAWNLWTNDTPLELIDPILKKSCDLSMALRYLHVGLLCVQEHPDDRPNISDIVAMIGNEMKVIEVQPKQPAYLDRKRAPEVKAGTLSLNELTCSMMQPR